MSFDKLTGNDALTKQLRGIARSGNIHNGYIFEGPWTADKLTAAKAFAKAVLCTVKPGEGCDSCRICRAIDDDDHMDVVFVEAENADTQKAKEKAEFGEDPVFKKKKNSVKSIRDAKIEDVIGRLNKVPIEGDRNIAIIKDADTITLRAFNRLLKTLEEPHEGTIIMLLSENIENLPQTIVSRCVHLRVLPSDVPKNVKEKKLADKLVAQIAEGEPYYLIKNTIEKIGNEKTEIYTVLDCMEGIYREMLLSKDVKRDLERLSRAIEMIEEARDRIKRNRNTAYTLKSMALRIGG